MKKHIFKLNLKIKVISLTLEGKVEDVEEVLKMSKTLEAQMVEKENAKNKAQVVAHVMKGKDRRG